VARGRRRDGDAGGRAENGCCEETPGE